MQKVKRVLKVHWKNLGEQFTLCARMTGKRTNDPTAVTCPTCLEILRTPKGA